MGFVEGSFGGGLVADEESEVFWEAGLVGLVGEGLGLEAEGSPGEPLIVRHSLDEELFAGGNMTQKKPSQKGVWKCTVSCAALTTATGVTPTAVPQTITLSLRRASGLEVPSRFKMSESIPRRMVP